MDAWAWSGTALVSVDSTIHLSEEDQRQRVSDGVTAGVARALPVIWVSFIKGQRPESLPDAHRGSVVPHSGEQRGL